MNLSRALIRLISPKSAAILDHYDQQQELADWVELQCENTDRNQKRLERFLAQPSILDRIDNDAE